MVALNFLSITIILPLRNYNNLYQLYKLNFKGHIAYLLMVESGLSAIRSQAKAFICGELHSSHVQYANRKPSVGWSKKTKTLSKFHNETERKKDWSKKTKTLSKFQNETERKKDWTK
jgi:hypothetical protein